MEAALEKVELDNRERAEGIRQAQAAAAKARAAELAADEANKRDIILQLRCAYAVTSWLNLLCSQIALKAKRNHVTYAHVDQQKLLLLSPERSVTSCSSELLSSVPVLNCLLMQSNMSQHLRQSIFHTISLWYCLSWTGEASCCFSLYSLM